MHYFIIPGNPPAAHFYEEWGREIKGHQQQAQIHVSRYPLLQGNLTSPEAMKEILNFHLEQLKVFHRKTNSPVSLVGHSLGGHFAMGLLEQEPNLVSKVILIHPFLKSPTMLGKIILNVAGGVGQSDLLQDSIVKIRRGLDYLHPAMKHITDEEILTSFQLARHESQTIGKDKRPLVIGQDHKDKVTVFYTNKDTWCSPESIRELKKQVTVIECTEPHAFVTGSHHRRSLFEKILGLP